MYAAIRPRRKLVELQHRFAHAHDHHTVPSTWRAAASMAARSPAAMRFSLAPGAVVPLHDHTGVELTNVLEASPADAEGECTAGNFVWRPAGNTHEAVAPNGTLLLGVFMKPNHFAAAQKVFTAKDPG